MSLQSFFPPFLSLMLFNHLMTGLRGLDKNWDPVFARKRFCLSTAPCWHAGGRLLWTERKRVNHVCMGLPTRLEEGDSGRKCRDLCCPVAGCCGPTSTPSPTPTLLRHGVDQQQTEGQSVMDVGGCKTQLRQTDMATYTNASHPSFPNTNTTTPPATGRADDLVVQVWVGERVERESSLSC